MIDLEESYYAVEHYQLVMDCDHGLGEAYIFKHKDKVFAFTYYKEKDLLSLLEVTTNPSYLDKETEA
jgi:hypothetical protein